MKKMYWSAALALAAMCLGCAVTVLADIPAQPAQEPPIPPKRENTVKLTIVAGSANQEAQLWLPAGWYAGQSPGVGSIETPSGGLSSLNTVVTGVALSLAMMLGGLWLVRSRRQLGGRNTATAAILLVVLGGTASYALANAAPPRDYHKVEAGTLRRASPGEEPLIGTVRYYYGTENEVRLVLPAQKP